MTYNGDIEFPYSFNIQSQMPLDCRSVVDTYEDLTTSLGIFIYIGMLVYVRQNSTANNVTHTKGYYYWDGNAWVEFGGGSNVNTDDCVKFTLDNENVKHIALGGNVLFDDDILPNSATQVNLGDSDHHFWSCYAQNIYASSKYRLSYPYVYEKNGQYVTDVYDAEFKFVEDYRHNECNLRLYYSGEYYQNDVELIFPESSGKLALVDNIPTIPLTLTKNATGFSISGGTTSKTLNVTNSYTLGSACEKGFIDASSARAISTSGDLPSERTIYHGLPNINGNHTYNSGTNIYAPTSAGTSGYILKSSGSGAPSWIQSVPFANGGTGSTSRLGAAQALTNESVASPEYVVSLTTNWGKFGYSTLAQLLSSFSFTLGILKVQSTATNAWSASYTNIIGSLSLSSTTCGLGNNPTTSKGWFFKFNKSKIFRGCLLNKGLTSAYILRNGTGTSDTAGMTFVSEMSDTASYYICGNYSSGAYYLIIGL